MSYELEFHGPWVSNTGDSGAFYESLQWGQISLDPGESFNKVEGTKVLANGVQGNYTPGVTGINDGGTPMVAKQSGSVVTVTTPQVRAAQALVARGDPRESVRKIAEAKPSLDGILVEMAAELDARTGRNADGTLLSGVDVVDPVTGGSKGMKPERYGLLPVGALAEVARVYGYGSEKYDDRNWEKSYAWSLSYDALQRHINAFWGGEINDPESGLAHLAHAAFHILTLLTFAQKEIGTDDRSNL